MLLNQLQTEKLLNNKTDNHSVPRTIRLVTKHRNRNSHILRTYNFKISSIVYFLTCLLVFSQASQDSAILNHKDKSVVLTVDVGSSIIIPCGEDPSNSSNTPTWIFLGPQKHNTSGSLIKNDSGLYIGEAESAMAGRYQCQRAGVTSEVILRVMDVPNMVINMTVSTYTVYALVSWEVNEANGSSLTGFSCQFRRDTSQLGHLPEEALAKLKTWQDVGPKLLEPDSRTCGVYDLTPNTTYYFRVAATNRIGMGEFVNKMETTKVLVQTQPEGYGYGRVVVMSLVVSVIALGTVGSGIALLMVKHRVKPQPVRPLQESPGEEESLELVPHITLNPSFNIDMLEHIGPESCDTDNSEHAFLVNNNSEMNPRR